MSTYPKSEKAKSVVVKAALETVKAARPNLPHGVEPMMSYWDGRNTLRFWVRSSTKLSMEQRSLVLREMVRFLNEFGSFKYEGISWCIDIAYEEIEEPP